MLNINLVTYVTVVWAFVCSVLGLSLCLPIKAAFASVVTVQQISAHLILTFTCPNVEF